MTTVALGNLSGTNPYIRVAKPGYDALSDAAQSHLLLQTSSTPLGSYATGTISPINSAYRRFGLGGQCSFAYSNPFGYLPLVFLQQDNGDGTWGGDYLYEKSVEYKDYEDTTPPRYYYDNYTVSTGFKFGVNPSNIVVSLFGGTNTIRYHVFSNQASSNPYGAQDITPDGLAWTGDNEPGNVAISSTATVANLGTGVSIVLRIDSTQAQGASSAFQLSATITNPDTSPYGQTDVGTYYYETGEATIYIPVQNGDQVQFSLKSNDNAARDIGLYVYNDTAGDTFIGDFALYTGYVLNVPSPAPVFGNVSGTSSGNTAAVTIQGINVNISLAFVFSSTFVGYIGLNGATPTYFNGANQSGGQYGNWIVYNNESVYFTITPTSTFNGAYGVVNQTANQQINSNNLNITVAGGVVASWSSLSTSGFSAKPPGAYTLTTSTATINTISGTHTLSVSQSGSRAIKVFVNGTATTLSPNGTFTVTSGASVYFTFSSSGYAQYTDTVTVTDSTTGTSVSSWTISIDLEGNN
jgi:hypothetical protein